MIRYNTAVKPLMSPDRILSFAFQSHKPSGKWSSTHRNVSLQRTNISEAIVIIRVINRLVCALGVFCYTLAFFRTIFSSNLYMISNERHYKWIRTWSIKANYAHKLKAAHATVLLLGPHSEAKQNRVWVETDTKSHIEHLIRNLRVTWTTTGLEPRILRGGTSVMRAESAERCTACAEMGKAAACAWEPSQVPCFTHLWRESSYLRDVVPIFHQQKTFGDQYNDEFSLQRAITPGQDDALIFFIDPVQTVL